MATKELQTQEGRELWDPFQGMPSLSDVIEGFFSGLPSLRGTSMPKAWAPRVDIHEKEKEYEVTASLPGVKKEDVKVTVDNGMLTISGERRSEKEEKDKTCLRHETQYGYFSRSFMLPESIHPEQIKASYEDGMLRLTLPKPELKKSRGVNVKVE